MADRATSEHQAAARHVVALIASITDDVAEWARQSKRHADVAERWAWTLSERISEWAGFDDESDDAALTALFDALSDIEDIGDYWDIEHPPA